MGPVVAILFFAVCVVNSKASAPFADRLVFLLAPPKTFDYIPSLHAKEDNKVDGQYAGNLITMLL